MTAPRTITDLVETSVGLSGLVIETLSGREDAPAMRGYAECGVPWHWVSCASEDGLRDTLAYRVLVDNAPGSAWMDNTTIVTACALMSDEGADVMTPLTIWDLSTFARAVVCYPRIYHHKHPNVDDARVNELLGGDVLRPVPLPFRATTGSPLPDPWNGAHRFMCEIWEAAYSWLRNLHESIGTETLNGEQIKVVTEAWRTALGIAELEPSQLVDFKGVDERWTSPSNRLLSETANITDVLESRLYLDPGGRLEGFFAARRKLGLPDNSEQRRSHLLSDLNLRAYVNQRIAEFFLLPYACSLGRVPFCRHLYDRSLRVQQELTAAKVIDSRYGELAQSVQLRLPIFLALALREATTPVGLWAGLRGLRVEAAQFRAAREQMDQALERGDLKEAKRISKALRTSVDSLLEIAGKATSAASAVILEGLSKGDISTVGTSIGVATAATKSVLRTSFVERLMWRLRRPQLLWVNNLIDQAHQLTEALPAFSKIWEIPPNRQAAFVERFRRMALLSN